jgi:cell division protein FtsB
MKHEQSELVQYKLDSYAKNESAKARADKLEEENDRLKAENEELKEEVFYS